MSRPGPHASHSTRNHPLWQEGIALFLTLAAIVLFALWPQLVEGRRLYWGDIDLYFTPSLSFLRGNLRSGIVPLWNPRVFCGTPYVGNPQTWPFYPTSILLFWLTPGAFINWSVGVHLVIAGLGTYFLSRRGCRLGVGSSLLAATVFMLNGQIVSKEQFPNMVQAIAWLPFLVLGTIRLTDRPTLINSALLGLAAGLELLSAHGQIAAIGSYLCIGVMGTGIAGKGKIDLKGIGSVIGYALLAGIIALCTAAVQILPMIGFLSDSARENLTLHDANRFYLPFNQVTNFFLPLRHGHPMHGNWTGHGNFWETCVYTGWLPSLLALAGIASAFRHGGSYGPRLWSAVFLISVWLSLGRNGGLYSLAFHVLPGVRSFHDPARFLAAAALALSLLSAQGADSLIRWALNAPYHKGTVLIVPAAVLIIIGYTAHDLGRFDRRIYPTIASGLLHRQQNIEAFCLREPSLKNHQTRLLAPDSSTTWQNFTTYRDYRSGRPDYFGDWYDTGTPNLFMSNGVNDAFGYDPFMPKGSADVAGGLSNDFLDSASPKSAQDASRLCAALGVRWVVLYRRSDPEGRYPDFTLWPFIHPERPGLNGLPVPCLLFDNLTLGRARVTNSFISSPSRIKYRELVGDSVIGKSGIDLSKTVILPKNSGELPGSSLYILPVVVHDAGPDSLAMRFKSKQSGMLVLSDTAFPGWKVWRDGSPCGFIVGDSMFRVVPVPVKGRYQILMRFEPELFRFGLFLTFSMVTLFAAMFSLLATRKWLIPERHINQALR